MSSVDLDQTAFGLQVRMYISQLIGSAVQIITLIQGILLIISKEEFLFTLTISVLIENNFLFTLTVSVLIENKHQTVNLTS